MSYGSIWDTARAREKASEAKVGAVAKAAGRTIQAIHIESEEDKVPEDSLVLTFTDGSRLWLQDDGQSCCEHRYLTSDDEFAYFVGGEFMGVEILTGPDEKNDEYGGVHEIDFLHIHTSKGSFTVCSHNEHNGWYGGISIVPFLEEAEHGH